MGINRIIFDIDETLVENEIFPSNLELIKKEILFLKEKNYSFGICTNRPLEDFVKKIVDIYLIDDYIICEGGSIIYKKENEGFIEIKNFIRKDINKYIKKKLSIFDINNSYIYNEHRKCSSTIRVNNNIDYVVYYLKSLSELKNYFIEKSNNKILIHNKKIDKIKVINTLYKDRVIFVTDYEKYLSKPEDNVLVYSVGEDDEFNNKCHYVFDKSCNGVLEILKKEGEKYE